MITYPHQKILRGDFKSKKAQILPLSSEWGLPRAFRYVYIDCISPVSYQDIPLQSIFIIIDFRINKHHYHFAYFFAFYLSFSKISEDFLLNSKSKAPRR